MNISKKLNYYQICSLLAQGKKSEIPESYNIIWLNDIEPHKVFDERISNNKLKFVRNTFIVPDAISVSGEYQIIMPHPSYDLNENSSLQLLDYGDVLVRTQFLLDKLDFYFYDLHQKSYIESYINQITDSLRSYVRKSDLTFDISLEMTCGNVEVYNVLMESLTYGDEDKPYSDTNIAINLSLLYDYYRFLID